MKKARKNKNIYYQSLTFENLYSMWNIVKKTCKNKREIFYFSLNLNANLTSLYHDLKNCTYTPGKYRAFMIFEPKPRLVMSQSVRDKIANHFITNYCLIPCLEKSLVDSNVATRKNRGSSYAMCLLKKYMNQLLLQNPNCEIYCLKIDISKYFYSISHEILLDKLQDKILDSNVISIISSIISETNKDYINEYIRKYNTQYDVGIPFYQNHKGLSIGAMTSQFLAIYYLNDLDHYIKETLHCKYYIRYMDDFLIPDSSKEKLKSIWQKINQKIVKLDLRTNSKSNIYRGSKGFGFLGFHYKVQNGKLNISFQKKTFYKINRKLKFLKKNDLMKYKKSMASYYGYFQTVIKNQKEDFKMKSIEVYEAYKKKYTSTLVLVKEGIFYHSYYGDGKILWYLFHYKYINHRSSFGNVPYDKVISRLKELDISFAVVSKEEEYFVSKKDSTIYNHYLDLSVKSYDKFEREEYLLKKLKRVYQNDSSCFQEIDAFLDEISKKQLE